MLPDTASAEYLTETATRTEGETDLQIMQDYFIVHSSVNCQLEAMIVGVGESLIN